MKLIHLSDLHIGIRVNEFSMLEDQKYILLSILKEIDRICPQVIILAGDIYDKPVPSAEAVQVLDDFITSIARRHIPVLMISGNHDSGERLGYAARLLRENQVYVESVYQGRLEPVILQDEYGTVEFYLLPFIKPAQVRPYTTDSDIHSYQEAVAWVLAQADTLDEKKYPDQRRVLVAHQFVTGAKKSESEEIHVGGLDNVDSSLFDAFDYVALGHIHNPQTMGRPQVRYCGTPLKYSFSEANQEKSITVVELGRKGEVSVTQVPLIPLHDLREIKGTYMELTSREYYKDSRTEDYLHITLTDEEDVPDALAKLRSIYPNIMKLDYDNRRTKNLQKIESGGSENKSLLDLFKEFYFKQNNSDMTEKQEELVAELLEKAQEEAL